MTPFEAFNILARYSRKYGKTLTNDGAELEEATDYLVDNGYLVVKDDTNQIGLTPKGERFLARKHPMVDNWDLPALDDQ